MHNCCTEPEGIRRLPVSNKGISLFPLSGLNDVTHLIQLAIAPVFLLNAVASIIGVLINRLSRAVDRTRVLDERLDKTDHKDAQRDENERQVLRRRLRLIYMALTCEVLCALFVGLLIAAGFVGAITGANFSLGIAALFVFAMAAFIGGLTVFLREIFLAVGSTRDSMR
jgi:cation transport ATPase